MSAVLSAVEPVATDPEGVERTLRVQLAAAYRLVEHFGWSELIYGHLTVRLPGETPTFLINPYGLNYDEVTASSLVRIDVDGNVVGESNHPVNQRRLRDPLRHPHGELRQQVRHAHPYPGRHGRCRPRGRPPPGAHVLDRVPWPPRLPRVRGAEPRPRGARTTPRRSRRRQGDDPPQPRAPHGGAHHPRGVHLALSPGTRLPGAARRDGGGPAPPHRPGRSWTTRTGKPIASSSPRPESGSSSSRR